MTSSIATAPAAHDFLRFVWDQSYDKTFGQALADWMPAPDPAPGIDPNAGAIPLAAGLHGTLDAVTYPIDWSRPGSTAVTPFVVQALLYNALGLLRREARHTSKDHRAFPSPRSIYPTHAYYLSRDDGEARASHYDPIAHALRPVADSPAADDRLDGIVALASHYTQIPDYYYRLRYTLGLLETGHCLYTLALVARALGLASRAVLSFDDEAILARLQLEPADGWAVPALVELGAPRGQTLSDSVRPGARRRARAAAGEPPVDRACWLDAPDDRRAWRQIDPPAPPRVPAGAFPLGAGQPPSPPASIAHVLFDRNAGRGVDGLSAAHGRIPLSVVSNAVREGFRRLDCDLAAGHGWSRTGVRVLLAANRVADLEDGVYEVCPREQALAPIRTGRLFPDLQRAFPSTLYVDSYNLAWFFVVDYPRVVGEWGPRGFRVVNLELGWAAQAISCAMAADGLFARPLRSYYEAVLDPVLRLSPAESVGYALVCGVNRFRDIRLDIRC